MTWYYQHCSLMMILSGRYLTTSGIEKSRAGKDSKERSSKPKQKQKGRTSALQPEIVEAALMHEAQEEAVQHLEKQTAEDVPVHTPKVVSAFNDASQTQVRPMPLPTSYCSFRQQFQQSTHLPLLVKKPSRIEGSILE